MLFHVDAEFGHLHAFGFEQFPLQGSVGLANQEFAAVTDNAMPGHAFSGRRGSHSVARGARAAAQFDRFR